MADRLAFRQASGADRDAVLELLDESAQWLVDRGIRQRYVPFPPSLVEDDLEHHRVFLAIADGRVVATAAALNEDPTFWGDQPSGSWYLHRLARRRDAPGAGRALLEWIEEHARGAGVERLRLDCGEALRTYYQDAGYELGSTMSLLESTSAPPRTPWFCYEKMLTSN